MSVAALPAARPARAVWHVLPPGACRHLRRATTCVSEAPDGRLSPPRAAVVLSVFCTAITFHLTYRIINDEGASAAVVGYLLPVVSLLLVAVVLSEDIGVRVVLGMAVVLVGVGMTRRQGTAAVTEERAPEESATYEPAAEGPDARHTDLEDAR
ncbi:EamA family transporter [Streptomyces sp. NPDC002911]